jgi:hypothetical protein
MRRFWITGGHREHEGGRSTWRKLSTTDMTPSGGCFFLFEATVDDCVQSERSNIFQSRFIEGEFQYFKPVRVLCLHYLFTTPPCPPFSSLFSVSQKQKTPSSEEEKKKLIESEESPWLSIVLDFQQKLTGRYFRTLDWDTGDSSFQSTF